MPNPTTRLDKAEPVAPAAAAPPPGMAVPVQRTLRLLRRYRQWNAGETAGFGASLADELIRQGVAVDVACTVGPAMIRK